MKRPLTHSLIIIATLANISAKAHAGTEPETMKEIIQKLSEEEAKQNNSSQTSTQQFGKTTPLGENKSALPPECHPQEFQRQALATYSSAQQYAKFTQAYFQRCSKFLTAGNVQGLPGLLKFANTEYDLSKNPQIQQKLLQLSDGIKIEAYVGVKDYKTRRPWVIAKCGVFCDITASSSSLNFIINFFDQSPFNIIFVSNHTGEVHIRNNSMLTLGGYYEVHDMYDLARWLKFESPYKDTVDSIHAVGISLGGSTAMAVSHLSHLYSTPNEKPLFNSTTAICPVVNLGPTLQDMYANSLKGKLFTQYTWKYLKRASAHLSLAQDYLSRKNPPEATQFPSMLADIVFRYGTQWEKVNPLGRFAQSPNDPRDLLNQNDFASFQQNLDIPTFAWASKDDHIVNYNLNTKTLIEAATPREALGAVGLEYGDHCGFDTAYGFAITTMVFQTFILGNSPDYLAQRHLDAMTFPVKPLAFASDEIHLRQWWVANSEKDSVDLYFETFKSNRGLSCRMADPFKSPSTCRKTYRQEIPINKLGLLGIKKPTTNTEAEILSRKLNIDLRLTKGDQPIDGSSLRPSQIWWPSFSHQ